jgi:hypothetical protein
LPEIGLPERTSLILYLEKRGCGLNGSQPRFFVAWKGETMLSNRSIPRASVIPVLAYCQYRLKIPHSADRKSCHPPEKMVESFSRLVENEAGW